MKLTEQQLRAIISQTIVEVGPKRIPKGRTASTDRTLIGHLYDLSTKDPRAFKAFVDMLIEDCDYTFYKTVDGKYKAVDRLNSKHELTWDPSDKMEQWEEY